MHGEFKDLELWYPILRLQEEGAIVHLAGEEAIVHLAGEEANEKYIGKLFSTRGKISF
ncbi:hypothetical protein AB1K32_26090 [Metabacillus dongyingensis]|uniref:hypothetical protein n=1 Tax=Metabacillus dongyingensis TaxID=2874282 RepID=UPI003B8BDB53